MFSKRVFERGVGLLGFIRQHNCIYLGPAKRDVFTSGTISSPTGGNYLQATEELKRVTAAITSRKSDIFSPERVNFGNMTTLQLLRSIIVLRICSLPGFSDHAHRVLQVTRKCLGQTIFTHVMRKTVYGQFVAGNETTEIREAADKLAECNLQTILAVPIEADAGDSKLSGEELLNDNLTKVIRCIDISRDIRRGEKPSLMQVKFTALVDYDVLAKVSTMCEKEIIETKKFSRWMEGGCQLENMDSVLPGLSTDQKKLLVVGMERIDKVFQYAAQNNVYVLVDAEYTWINPALSLITVASMIVYNKSRAVVWNTYQGYLKATRGVINEHKKICNDAGVMFGFKLVRGAYLLQESQKAGGHPEWVCDDWNHTNENYDLCLYESVRMDPRTTEVMFATHNENSVRLAAELLRQRLEAGTSIANVRFGQLYGMADYMGYTLGKMGYDVYKSVPYGSIEDTLQYLARRAKENTLFLTGIRKDMDMLKKGFVKKIRRRDELEDHT